MESNGSEEGMGLDDVYSSFPLASSLVLKLDSKTRVGGTSEAPCNKQVPVDDTLSPPLRTQRHTAKQKCVQSMSGSPTDEDLWDER